MVLKDHIRRGKVFIPKPKQMLTPLQEVHYPEHILPEIIWMGYLIHAYGERRGIKLVSDFIQMAYDIQDWSPWPEFTFVSSYRALSPALQTMLIDSLERHGVLDEVRVPLSRFIRCYPEGNPMIFLLKGKHRHPYKKDLAISKAIIDQIYDRRSYRAVVLQSLTLYTGARAGKIKYTPDVPLPNLNAIVDDFEGQEGQRAAAHVRCTISQFHMVYMKQLGIDWATYFWTRGFQLERSELRLGRLHKPPTEAGPFHKFAVDYENYTNALLERVWVVLPKSGIESEVCETLGCLLARQAHLSLAMARSPDLWEWDFGPLFLRSMTDCHITIAWVLTSPVDHARKYIDYGLGQTKLMIEHYQEALDHQNDPAERDRMQAMIDAQSTWLENQHFSFLQDVNVGAWAGISTREMAQEVGCLDLYRYAYTPYSGCVHNTWSHLGRFYCAPCDNPLHKFIKMPCHPDIAPHPDVFMNSVKYFEMSVTAIVEHYGVDVGDTTLWEWTGQRMSALVEELNERAESRVEGTGC